MTPRLRGRLLAGCGVLLLAVAGAGHTQEEDTPCKYMWVDRNRECVSSCSRVYQCPCLACLL